jgi:hypothetical protein
MHGLLNVKFIYALYFVYIYEKILKQIAEDIRIIPQKIQKICLWRNNPQWAMASSFTKCLDHIQRRTTVGGTPLNWQSARRRDLYLTTNNTHNRQTTMPLVGFESTISGGERPQTQVLDRAATEVGNKFRISHTNEVLYYEIYDVCAVLLHTFPSLNPCHWTTRKVRDEFV